MALVLLHCLARAVAKNAFKGLLQNLPFGEALFDVAKDAIEDWKRRRADGERRAELEALANATPAEACAQAEQAAAQVAPPGAEREALAGYLARLPGVVRRSLARPEDMTGRTVPARLTLDRPEDLVPFLPPRPPRFKPGDRVSGGGDWVLEELLGVGGFGEVWKAAPYAGGGSPRALKFCLAPEAVSTLRTEEVLLGRVMRRGPVAGIVALRAACLGADPPFLVYDYVAGGDLTRLIRGWHQSPSSPRLAPEAVRLVRHLATTLSSAHESAPPVVHRDLKPSNILLQPSPGDDNKVRLRVADFGIGGVAARQAVLQSRSISSNEALTTGLRGAHTPLYASPQQMDGGPPDPRDDVYALGVIGYQVLTGDTTVAPPPDWEDELTERQVPRSMIGVLGRCLASALERRPAHAAALAELLRALP